MKFFYFFATIFIFYSAVVKSGSYESAIDAQSEVMRQTLQDAGELQRINREKWNRLTERQRYIISNTGEILDKYYNKNQYYPSRNDGGFIQWLYNYLNISSQAEAQIVLDVIDERVESKKVRNDICRNIQGYGFGAKLMDNFCK